MSGIIDAADDLMKQLDRFIQNGTRAFVTLLIMLFITIPLAGILASVVFDTLSKTTEDVPGAEGVIGGAQTVYDVVGTFQDAFDVVKVIYPVLIAVGAVIVACIAFFDRIKDWLENTFNL